jgi:hypothetical protein
VLAAVVLVALVLVAALSGPYGARGALLLAAVSVLWFVVNGPMEGLVLVRFTDSNGLTGGDLAGLAGLGVAGYRLYRLRRKPLNVIDRLRRPGRRWR